MRRIVIPGGSGCVGHLLASHFHEQGDQVTVLSRTPRPAPWSVVAWDVAAWDVRQLDIAIDELPSDGNNTRVDETWSDVDAPEIATLR